MSIETWDKIHNQYSYAWVGGELKRSRYPYTYAQSVTSERDKTVSRRVNPFSLTKTNLEFIPGRYRRDSDGIEVSGPSIALIGLVDLYSGGYPSASWYSDVATVKALALQRLYGRASEPYFREIHQFGELAETVGALKSPLKGIRTLGGSLSKMFKDPRKAKLPIKDAAGAYLEHIYGTAPMFGQAAMFGDAAGRMLDNAFPKERTVRAGAKQVHVSHPEQAFSTYINGYARNIFEHCSCYYTFEGIATAKAGAGMYITNPRLRNSLNFAGLAAEGWELLPLSFLANMFVDVASLLRECRPVAGNISDAWCTTVGSSASIYTLKSVSGHTTLEEGQVTIERSLVTRTTDVFRTGKLHLGPGLNSLGKVLSTAALGVSKFT